MNARFGSAVDELRRLESDALGHYRALAPRIPGPAERRLAESVIDRKAAHDAKLAALASAFGATEVELSGDWPFKYADAGRPDDAADAAKTLLALIFIEESALSRSYEALASATAAAAPEAAFDLRALSASSGKFASWAEEHLELLGLG